MSLKIDDIEKYDMIIRKKHPNAEMRKISQNKLIWVGEYGIVGKIQESKGKIYFDLGK